MKLAPTISLMTSSQNMYSVCSYSVHKYRGKIKPYGHSISGIYGLDYVNKYEHEVSVFVGIDSSNPMQYGGKVIESPISSTTITLLKKSGLARLEMKLSADLYAAINWFWV
ncbi:hypothetical protein D3C78_1152720 [compost metagenome]